MTRAKVNDEEGQKTDLEKAAEDFITVVTTAFIISASAWSVSPSAEVKPSVAAGT